MAYTVGSVSVEVVPDFRNAQNAITAFFRAQPDKLEVPVRPDLDQRSVAAVERQAAEMGTRVGKAIGDNASRSMSSNLTNTLSRQISKLENDIARARRTSADATSQLRIAEARLNEAKAAGVKDGARLLSLERAVEVQRRRISDADRIAAESAAQLVAVRRQLAEETARSAEEAARRAAAAQAKADQASITAAERTAARQEAELRRAAAARQRAAEIEVRQALTTAQRVASERERVNRQAEAVAARERERVAREEEKFARDAARRAIKAAADEAKRAEKIRLQVEIDERQAIEAGRNQGGLIARSVRHEIHQNAGLIAGVLSGALLLGGPALLAAATTVFVGVGAVAAAQSERVRSAWVGTWDQIKAGAISDAGVLVPVFERMAGAIAASFERMRPLLRTAFEAIGPQIDSFTGSLTKAAENALPGLVHAIEAGGPVVKGLGDALESIGTGFSDFFDRLSTAAPQAGTAFSQFGELLGTALPLLGELLAIGTQVATHVLPVLTGAFRGVLSVLDALGGVLPSIVTGFLAFRVIQGTGRYLQNLSSNLGMAAIQGGVFSSTAGKAATAVSRLGKALPVVGIVAGGVAAGMQRMEEAQQRLTNKILEGPDALERLKVSLEAAKEQASTFGADDSLERRFSEAKKAADDYVASLTPLERAQRNVDVASRELSTVIGEFGSESDEAKAKSGELARAQADLAREQDKLAQATRGVTEAMVEQSNQARALADSSFAYEQSLIDLEEAQADYNEVMKDSKSTDLDKRQALLDLQEGYKNVADAARDVALDSLPALLDEQQAAIIADKAQLDALLALKAEYGDLGPILENQIRELSAATSGANANKLAQANLAAALEQVGISVESIPDSKSVIIDDQDSTPELLKKLDDLGFTIEELPDGDIKVTADTAEAEGNLDQIDTHLFNTGRITATPIVDLNPTPFDAVLSGVNSLIVKLHGQKPTPIAFMNANPFTAVQKAAMAAVATLNGQKPTPVANMSPDPFNRVYSGVMAAIANVARQSPTPSVNARDNASGTIAAIQQRLNNLQDRTVVITTVNRAINQVSNVLSGGFGWGAEGGAVEHLPMRRINFDRGGAVVGPGFGIQDMVPAIGPDPSAQYRIGNGEHIWDTRDVAMAGGQAGVYALRDLIGSGRLGTAPVDTIRQMVSTGDRSRASGDGGDIIGFANYGTIELRDESQFYRQQEMARRELMVAVLG